MRIGTYNFLKSMRTTLVVGGLTAMLPCICGPLAKTDEDKKFLQEVAIPTGLNTAAGLIGGAIVLEAIRRRDTKNLALDKEAQKVGIPMEVLDAFKNGTCDKMGVKTQFTSNLSTSTSNKNIQKTILCIDAGLNMYYGAIWKVFEIKDIMELNATRDQILSHIEKGEQIPKKLLKKYDDIFNERRLYPYIFDDKSFDYITEHMEPGGSLIHTTCI